MKRLQRRLRSSSSRNGSSINGNGSRGKKDNKDNKDNDNGSKGRERNISDKNDVSSKRSSPSPGTSVSSNSGNVNNNNIILSSIDDRSSKSSSTRSLMITSQEDNKIDVDQNLAEKTINLSMGSSSSLFSKSKDSTFSNGLSIDQDSFVVMSTTGLSSVGSSFNSFYSYDPFTGNHGRRNRRRSDEGNGVDLNVSQSSNNKTPQQQQHNYLHSKKRTSRLPRLTIPSCAHTQAFLQNPKSPQDELVRKQIINISPISSNTVATEPITPRDYKDFDENNNDNNDNNDNNIETNSDNNSRSNSKASTQEFPTNPLDSTPEFHIPNETNQPLQQNALNHNSSLSSNIYSNSTYSRYGSSSCGTSYISGTSSKQISRENKMVDAAIAEKEFWERELRATVIKYGQESVETARQLNNLGSALLRCKEYSEAFTVYKRMVGILRRNFDQESLVFARGLDKVGLAASKCPSPENLELALLALNEALHLRISQIGPHHCDTVDTLNNIAGIFLHMKEWSKAKDAYVDVLTVRAAIFGNNHPSVAVTAQTLGKVCSHLSDFDASMEYFELALSIYRGEPMMLRDSHPLISKTIRNIDRTERLMGTLRLNYV